ncbi:septal ring lytic transglycosylase RlpA family protein [Phormidium sp. CCY1219]|uniref:septal ring lytic transglycosylase RlpA family protein n=1 Tax=Phormidium sp. CCY1219 TaxID=2886104 RepID=UPI002D1E5E1C|nr:septal ring lytic transglycosylase RlpA family protein [Phormidium sp. CCY1219]MEB3829309.1 septal ring lytic transglycosylase RlpA family protein [Phormidium sp. CCY1219]
MQFLGLVWMTCCLSSLWLSSQTSINYSTAANATPFSGKTLSAMTQNFELRDRRRPHPGRRAAKPDRRRPVSQRQNPPRARTLPGKNLQISANQRPSKTRNIQPFTTALNWFKPAQKSACISQPKQTNQVPKLGGEAIAWQSPPRHLAPGNTIAAQRFPVATPVGFLQNLWQPKTATAKPPTTAPVTVKVVTVHPFAQQNMTRDDRDLTAQWIGQHFSRHSQATTPVMPLSQTAAFQVWVKGYFIAQLPDRSIADLLAYRVQQWLQDPDAQGDRLQLAQIGGVPVLQAGVRPLFAITRHLANQLDRSGDLLAIEWLNNLRIALSARPVSFVEAQKQIYGLVETNQTLQGTASWYGAYFHHRLTATGELFDQQEMTAAHRTLPFDTYLKVTNLHSGNSVIVRINDRGPYIPPRSLDLSLGAARCIGSEEIGVIPYKAVIMKPGNPSRAIPSNQMTQL